jgi:pimeloyl-ACP methyl ester carboxylesterase
MVAHDWGVVGLALAQETPDSIERLVVVNAVPFLPGYRWHRVARIWRTPLAGELFMGSSSRWAMKQTMRWTRALPPDRTNEFVDAVWPYFDHGTQRAILKLYRSASADDLVTWPPPAAPALVVWGERDRYVPASWGSRIAEALGGVSQTVPGAGHWPWMDRPEVIERVCTFVSGRPGLIK